MADRFKHIFISGSATAYPYKSKNTPRSKKLWDKSRGHGDMLKKRFEIIGSELDDVVEERKRRGLDEVEASLISFEVEITDKLNLTSFEDSRAGIQLASFQVSPNDPNLGIVNVLVPDGKFSKFEAKLVDFLDPAKDTKKNGNPRNENLIKSIQDVRRAKIESLWTDKAQSIPSGSAPCWWEAWVGTDSDLARLRTYAERLGLRVSHETLRFLDRRVVLLFGTPAQLAESVGLLDVFRELRSAKPVTQDFVEMSAIDRAEWCADLAARIIPPSEDAPAVCLLDTGLLAAHPLFAAIVDPESDCDTYDSAWGSDDHSGHGTQMAGFALFGEELDLMLQTSDRIQLQTRIESVKILPRSGQNEPRLYGEITRSCASIADINNPTRRRVFAMAVGTAPSPDGQPDSWSAAIDDCIATEERLFVLAGGNIGMSDRYAYMDENATSPIEAPGQSWNAITVGAYTSRSVIEPITKFPDWKPVAPAGALSPVSRTGLLWDKSWPLKPDVLAEGGNLAWEPGWTTPSDRVESLRLLTTSADGSLITSGDTSAAANLVAKNCAEIWSVYPHLWPETVRALVLHSAAWTSPMLGHRGKNKTDLTAFVRVHGFGVPSLNRALQSAKNSATLIIEDEVQPFKKESSSPTFNEMNIHKLPWPEETLLALGTTRVRLRVTLSYFVQPNPARRGVGFSTKYQYASHGLKFDVKTSGESDAEFRRRISAAEGKADSESDAKEWSLGTTNRHRGSLHSDVWEGEANKLAGREYIAIFPSTGWWKTHTSTKMWESMARYALVVTLECDDVDVEIDGVLTPVDLYSPILQQVAVPIST